MASSHHSSLAAFPASRFASIKLSEDRLDSFYNSAHEALSQTIKEFVKLDGKPVDTNRWRYMRSRGAVSVYYDRRPLNAKLTSLLVAGTMKARLADVMEGLYMDNSEDTRLVQRCISTRFVDAEVLQVIEQRSVEEPFAFTGLKWSLIKTSSSGLIGNRDICFIEKLGTVNIPDGRKLGYFIMQSIDLPECPAPTSGKTERGHISLCCLIEELRDGLIGMYMIGNMQSYGPQFMWKVTRSAFADIAISIGNAVDIAKSKRFGRLVRSKNRPSRIPPRTIACELCQTIPSFFDHHLECSGCERQSVCKRCRTKCHIFSREHETSMRLARAVFCKACVSQVESPAPQAKPAPQVIPKFSAEVDEDSSSGIREDDGFSGSFSTVTEDESSDEHLPVSQRSLKKFSLKLLQQLEDVGYNTSSVSSRITGLSSLGSGECRQYCAGEFDNTEDEEGYDAGDFLSPSSSTASHSASIDEFDEDIITIQPQRRSTQPPEMLEAEELDCDGRRRRTRPYARSYTDVPDSELMSRLVQVSRTAEHTFQMTREQTEIAQLVLQRSRCHT